MKSMWLTAGLDIAESLRARWFLIYTLVFGGIVVALFITGVTESRIMGFTGISRLLITYVQICVAILPVFILITTVRSVAGDREAGIFEYLLSLPVSLSAWYWGKLVGRFLVIFLPVLLAIFLAALWAGVRGYEVPWGLFITSMGLLLSLAWCFLGLGMLISSLARSADLAQGAAFMLWLALLLFLDLILIGVMIHEQVNPDAVIAVALVNPMQVFRTATMALFDPQLMLMGPAAYVILDVFGRNGVLAFGIIYPIVLGAVAAGLGYVSFKRGDLP